MNLLNISNTHVLILSAGKIVEELEGIFGSISSGLIPINGKPIIFRIIDKLLEEGFSNFSITIGFKKEQLVQILEERYSKKIKLNLIEVDYTKSPGNSILDSIKKIFEEKLLVILGDTLVEENISSIITKNEDFVLTSTNFQNPEKWCVIKQNRGYVETIIDKKKGLEKNNLEALIGVYYFSNLNDLKNLTKNLSSDKIEISNLIEEYKQKHPIKTILCKGWYDVGHIENYYYSKKALLQARYFNYLNFDEILGIVTKTSDDTDKLKDEINWYKKIPPELSILTPRVIDYNNSTRPYIKLEYIGYPTLAELWLYSDIHSEIWKNIIKRFLDVINLFKKYRGPVSFDDYQLMYVHKTEQRVKTLLEESKQFRELFNNKKIIINNIEYKNWPIIKEKIYSKIKRLYNNKNNYFLHGDLCFSNILYDIHNGIFKLIDPRGKWGSTTFGDLKYDIAKLRHSVVGNYDSIIDGLYSISYNNEKIIIDIFKPRIYQEISRYFDELVGLNWNLNDIKLIEGLLFISMLPLHKDNLDKQIAFFSIGIQRLNEVIDN